MPSPSNLPAAVDFRPASGWQQALCELDCYYSPHVAPSRDMHRVGPDGGCMVLAASAIQEETACLQGTSTQETHRRRPRTRAAASPPPSGPLPTLLPSRARQSPPGRGCPWRRGLHVFTGKAGCLALSCCRSVHTERRGPPGSTLKRNASRELTRAALNSKQAPRKHSTRSPMRTPIESILGSPPAHLNFWLSGRHSCGQAPAVHRDEGEAFHEALHQGFLRSNLES